MKTYLDCIPCFFRQALEAARMVTDDEAKQKEILDGVARKIPSISPESTPPEMGHTIYGAAKRVANHNDPYKHLKDLYNRKALEMYPSLREEIRHAEDPLLLAIRFAIAGNVIDFGPDADFDIEKELEENRTRSFAIFDYESFENALNAASDVLYIGDNAGEIVFDKLLIEALKKPTVFVVRGEPIINDATMEDARDVGMGEAATVISSGCGAPGTVLRECSDEFMEYYEKAGLVISKGQGNYETLSGEKRPIFFLLKAKCPVIARDLGVEVGSIVLKGNQS
jgi:hypothetical protein